ncbi:hypothetical protein TraAM80_04208 [Trypanosoma rangeli]|uniref:Leucine-rich repeat protein (LRRP) n=1 Tax=Trypanosoma rangeli TaxID=5698 RepID=A0A3R7L235_TRYRA|nr:uncharacterized protein TraAM80_04208 [Trypanosoma rangeli]RNF06054.1 hypothetical protein TraAM80_04208 [Trypanosoma rangeli]|eukprot:RNF06054.1 hypothetical protein TraAM80_04208 [Trypanosoma rangeli]
MLPIVQEYMTQCAQRRMEPYYGFLERAGAGEIVADLDFAPQQGVRVFATTLLRCGPRSIAAKGPKLQVLALRYDSNKGMHHPPRQSRRMLSYSVLLAQRLPEDVIVAVQNRPLLRSLIDGVRVACMTYTRHLVRVELCGLPLEQVREVTARLFDVLQHCELLRVLKLNKSRLTDQLFTRLTTTANTFSALREAHFSECSLTDGSAQGVHSIILLNRGKEQSAIWRASLRDGGGSPATAPPCGLEALDLSGNSFGDATLRRLGLAIAHDASLRVVDMSRNAVTTSGLKEFLQQGALQTSVVASLDLSKNLIDTRDTYLVGDGFACQHTYEEQLLLLRVEPRERRSRSGSGNGGAAPRAREVRRRPMPPTPSLTTLPAPVSAVGAPLEVSQPRLSPEDNSDGGGRSGGVVDARPRASSLAVVWDAGEDDAEFRSQSVGEAGAPATAPPQSTRTPSSLALGRYGTASHLKADHQASEQPRCLQTEPGNREEERSPPPPPPPPPPPSLPFPLPPQQQQQGTMPFFPPLLFPFTGGSGDDGHHPQLQLQHQWCGVPLYVPVPVASFGTTPPLPPPPLPRVRSTRDAAVGTSPQSDTQLHSSAVSSTHRSLAAGRGGPKSDLDGMVRESCEGAGDDATAFENMMLEPLQTGAWEVADWRRNEQRFLEALILRVESHETATTEALERNYQATRDRLDAVQAEFSWRLQELLEEQRAESRQLRGELRERLPSEQQQEERVLQDPEAAMAEELARLIHTGMRHVHDQMQRPGSAPAAASFSHATTSAAVLGDGLQQATQDYLRVVKERLSSLGW